MLYKALAALATLVTLAAPGRSETVDEIIARTIEARGGLEKLKAVQSLRMKGRMTMGPGQDATLTVEMKRPRRARMELRVEGSRGVQAFDGRRAWGIPPIGDRTPAPLPPEMARHVENQADLEGPLVDYRAKGHAVELVGKVTLAGGVSAWKLKLTLKGGQLQHVYVDAASHLEVRSDSKRPVPSGEVEVVTTIGDYREQGGVLWPHAIRSAVEGVAERQSIVFESIEVNVPIDDARFEMPAAKP